MIRVACLLFALCSLFQPISAYSELNPRLQAKHLVGPNQRVWESVVSRTNQTGNVISQTNQVVELAGGLLRWQDNQWVEADPAIDILSDGSAAAENGAHKVYFSANINSPVSVRTVTPDGKTVRFRILGIAYFDFHKRQSVLISELQDSVGVLIGENQVLYANCFSDCRADVLYVNDRSGIEQFVILKEGLPNPEDFGFNPKTTWIEVWTEFLDVAAQPAKRQIIRKRWKESKIDQVVDFGSMQIAEGTAFSMAETPSKYDGIPVRKHWEQIEGRSFLIEEMSFPMASPQLQKLPQRQQAAILPKEDGVVGIVSNKRLLPEPRLAQNATSERMRVAKHRTTLEPDAMDGSSGKYSTTKVAVFGPVHDVTGNIAIRTANARDTRSLKEGFAVDFSLLQTETNGTYTFKSDTTYYVSGAFCCTNAIFEGGTVIKYTNDASITVLGDVTCKSGPYKPIVLTAYNDITVGELIEAEHSSETNRYADVALVLVNGGELRNMHIRYAKRGVYSQQNYSVWHSQFVHCDKAVHVEQAICKLENVLMVDVQSGIYGRGLDVTGEHLTMDQGTYLVDWIYDEVDGSCPGLGSTVTLRNSLITGVTSNRNAFVEILCGNDVVFNSGVGVYEARGAGSHYLPTNSPYFDCGTNEIDPVLQADLRKLTIFPPTLLSNQVLYDTVFQPQVTRDLGTNDLGYHYPPLDYLVGSGTIVAGTVLITNGTTLGVYATNSNSGVILVEPNGVLISAGTATNLNQIAWINTVQELPLPEWLEHQPETLGIVSDLDEIEIKCESTSFVRMGGGGYHITSTPLRGRLSFRDCSFGPGVTFFGVSSQHTLSVGITNCLFERNEFVSYAPGADFELSAYNNLFFGGSVWMESLSGSVVLRDNLFCLFSTNSIYQNQVVNLTHDHNAYLTNCNRLLPTNATDVVVNQMDFQHGPEGWFYQPTDSPLIDAGSRTGDVAGLSDYTACIDLIREVNSPVDIGFHYSAMYPLPIIRSHPQSITVPFRTNASLSVSAIGAGLVYQWRRSGTNILGATASILTFTPVRDTDHGTYDVIVSNGSGAVTSETAVVTMLFPPSMNTFENGGFEILNGSAFYKWSGGELQRSNLNNFAAISGSVAQEFDVVPGATYEVVYSYGSAYPFDWDQGAPLQDCREKLISTITSSRGMITRDVKDISAFQKFGWQGVGRYLFTVPGSVSSVGISFEVDRSQSPPFWFKIAVDNVSVRMISCPPPTVSICPELQHSCIGYSEAFVAAASSSFPLRYQWYRNGNALAGATGSTYLIRSVTGDSEGTYRVVVANGLMSANAEAVLIVHPQEVAPSISHQPTAQTACVGGIASFSVDAAGVPKPVYQWRRNGDLINGATNSCLSVHNAQATDEGSYDVVVSNAIGWTVSSQAVLTTKQIFITEQPQNTAATLGSTVYFAVRDQCGGVSLQWKKNGFALNDDGRISGTSRSTLTILNMQQSDLGSYCAVLSKGNDVEISSSAALTLSLSITKQPSPQKVAIGDDVTFAVAAVSSSALSYQWNFNGNIIDAATSSSLTLPNVQPSASGVYTVVISDDQGEQVVSGPVSLTVFRPPTICQQPQSQTVAEGDQASITVAPCIDPYVLPTNMNSRLRLWLKADQGVVTSSGSKVQEWRDSSPEGNDCQNRGLQDPEYVFVPENGKSALRMNSTSLPNTSRMHGAMKRERENDFTSFVVLRCDALWTQCPVSFGEYFNWDKTEAFCITNSKFCFLSGNEVVQSGIDVVSSSWRIWTLRVDRGNGEVAFFDTDGVGGATNVAAISTNIAGQIRNYYVGGTGSSADWFTGDIAEIVLYDEVLTEAERLEVETYLRAKYFDVPGPDPYSFAYQWRKNGERIYGATSSSLIFESAKPEDAGTYSVTVSCSSGTIQSTDSILIVNPSPRIICQPQDQTPFSGMLASFSVIATNGALSYQWYHSNRVTAIASLIVGATGSTFTTNATLESEGFYWVEVTNNNGVRTSRRAKLDVCTLLGQPQSQTITMGNNAVFQVTNTCDCSQFQWIKQGYGKLTDGADCVRGANTEKLTLMDVILPDAGSYQVIIGNGTQSITSSVATLTVNMPTNRPQLTNIRKIKLEAVGSSFLLTYAKLKAAAQPSDTNCTAFKVKSVLNGELTINGYPFEAGTENFRGNCRIREGDVVSWTPSGSVPAWGRDAFEVFAFNGYHESETNAPVKIVPIPPRYVVGWGDNIYGSLGNGDLVIQSDSSWSQEPVTFPVKVKRLGRVSKMQHRDNVGVVLDDKKRVWVWGLAPFGVVGEGEPDPDWEHTYFWDRMFWGKYEKTETIAGNWLFKDAPDTLWLSDVLVNFTTYMVPFKVQWIGEDGELEDFDQVDDIWLSSGHYGRGTMFATRHGKLYSWGAEKLLGRELPAGEGIKYKVPIGDGFEQVAAYYNVKAWTTNFIEEYLDATRTPRLVEIKDANGYLDVRQVACDPFSALAVGQDGSLWWWGSVGVSDRMNFADYSLAMSGGRDPRLPTRLSTFSNLGAPVAQCALSYNHYMARLANGTVWEFGYVPRLSVVSNSWELTDYNQFKYFTTNTPVLVTNLPTNVVSIAVGDYYSVALLNDGRVFAWGTWGVDGRLFTRSQPTQIPDLTNIIQIAVSGRCAMALDTNGYIWSWGNNVCGQLGQDTHMIYESIDPLTIFGIENVTNICAGDRSSLAIGSFEEGKPTGLTAWPLDSKIRLDWYPFKDASKYKVYRSLNAGFSEDEHSLGSQIAEPTNNTFLDTNVNNGTNFYYSVVAVVDGMDSMPSREANATPLPVPQAPSDVSIGRYCRYLQVRWEAATDANSYSIYRARTQTGPFSKIGQVSGSVSYNDVPIPNGSTDNYYYYIVAVNKAGEGPASATVGPVQLDSSSCGAAPVIRNVTVATNTCGGYDVVLKFAGVKKGTDDWAGKYRIQWYYGENPPTQNTHFISTTVGAEHLSGSSSEYRYEFQDSYNSDCEVEGGNSLPVNRLVWFKVSALWNYEEGADSETVGPILTAIRPDVPSQLRAVPGNQQVYLEWRDDPKTEYYTIDYKVADEAGTNWIPIGTNTQSRFWHTILTNGLPLGNGTNYEYQVTAWISFMSSFGNSNLCSSPAVTNARPVNMQPISATFTAVAAAFDSMVYVSWESLSQTHPYQCFVERKEGDGNFEVVSGTGIGRGFIDNSVVNGSTYTYRVVAFDTNYHRFSATTAPVTPSPTSTIALYAEPGNGYVGLNWGSIGPVKYLIRHSLTSGGPFEVMATTSETQFRHVNAQNGLDHFYVITAMLPNNSQITSTQVVARPLVSLAPLPPALRGTLCGNNVLLSWNPSSGAVEYQVCQVLGSDVQIFRGAGTSFAYALKDHAILTDGSELTFRVRAITPEGMFSEPGETTVTYAVPSASAGSMVLLSIGDESFPTDGTLSVTGPTNLTLRASVAAENAADAEVFFYARGELIGKAEGPEAQITWFRVPAGPHNIKAQAVIRSAGNRITGGGAKVYDSASCALTVKIVPEAATYQTGVTDLQLPAPGLPIVLSRSYDSRRTNVVNILGKGWSADWEGSLETESLAVNWVEAGTNILRDQYLIASKSDHTVTLNLPGGNVVQFGAEAVGYDNPLGGGFVRLTFAPYFENQGTLRCRANGDQRWLDAVVVDELDKNLWNGTDPIKLGVWENNDFDDFAPEQFIYTAPDATEYVFEQRNSLWKLTQIIDRNKNSLTYQYDTNGKLMNIVHSNGRRVQFGYGTTNGVSCVSVFDSKEPKESSSLPVIQFYVETNALNLVRKLVRFSPVSYETVRYNYGSSGDNEHRLTEVFDARGVRVLANEYGHATEELEGGQTIMVSDGRLISQTDARGTVTSFDLDAGYDLQIANVVNGVSQVATINHDESGNITNVVEPGASAGISIAYNAKGLPVAETDASGETKTISYDGKDRPVAQSDPLDNTTSMRLNALGDPDSSTDANGNITEFEYDGYGNLILTTDPTGATTETVYTSTLRNGSVAAGGLISFETRSAPDVPYSVITEYVYYDTNVSPPRGNMTGELKEMTQWSTADTNMEVTVCYEYDANGNRIQETKKGTVNGIPKQVVVTQFKYDPQNRLISTTDPYGGTSRIEYNLLGKQAMTVDAADRTNFYRYDLVGNLVETAYPDGTVTRTWYDVKNRPVFSQERAKTNSNSSVAPGTKTIYDAAGRVIRTERRKNVGFTVSCLSNEVYSVAMTNEGECVSMTRTEYDVNGRVKYSMDSRGTVTESFYDAAGRRTTNRVYTAFTVSPLESGKLYDASTSTNFVQTVYAYDGNGNQTSVKDALERVTQYRYDKANRLVKVMLPQVESEEQRCRVTDYDGFGRRIAETDEAGIKTSFGYDSRGLLTSVNQDAGGTQSAITVYDYDEFGNCTRQRDANRNSTQFQYDMLGRRTKRILIGNKSETFGYDISGNLIRHTNFNGVVLTNEYDHLNRLTNRTAPGGYRIGFTYTDWGARQSMIDASGTTTYTYDDMRRLITNATPQGTLFYAYDPSGSVTNISSSTVGGVRLGYGYDLLGRVTNVLERSVRAAHYSFDKVGNLARAHLSLSESDVVTNRLDYDALNRLTNSVWGWDWDPAPLADFQYKLGPTGSRTNLVETFYTSSYGANRTYNWQYDRLYRLTNEVVTGTASSNCSYSFDSVGNRLSWTNTPQTFATYGYDSNNRMTNCGIVPFVYDENGNTRTNGADVYRYDAENRLTNAVVGGVAISYVYNGDGIRVRKTLGSTTTLYLVDDKNPTGYAQVLEERTVTGGFTNAPTVYCWGLSIILQRHEAGFYYYCQDGHGNVRFMTDEFGEAWDAFAYDAYGTVIDESHQSLSHAKCTHLYTGEEWDPDLGMYYLRARWYRPEIGRFWTMDTFEGRSQDPLSLHKYLYCHDNPINGTDPSGHENLPSLNISMSLQSFLSSSMTRAVARTYGKNLKDREWVIWRVKCKSEPPPAGLFEHTFIWTQSIKSKRALGYHVFADVRDMALSRMLNEFVPGLFAVLPQPQIDRFGPLQLPIESKIPVMVLTKKQFVVWNALSVGWNALELIEDVAFGGIPYRIPDANCITWTDTAVRNAILVGAVPF